MMPVSLISEYVAGAAFGAALFSAGVYPPSTIIAQMRLQDFTMVKAMLGASATSAFMIYIADATDIAAMKPRTPQSHGLFPYDGNIIGGALIGIGMALTGACPGTVFVQAGAGLPSGIFVFLGGILGGLAFTITQPSLLRFRASRKPEPQGTTSALTIPQSLEINPLFVLLGWEFLCSATLRAITTMETPSPRSSLVSPIAGGLLIGLAQATALALTRHTIGTSGAFEDLGRWLRSFLPYSTTGKGPLTPAVLFGAGIISASAVMARFSAPAVSQAQIVSPTVAVVGGAVMVFGSRLAGGCTSGHGISGLATFSWASLVSVAAMFGAGVGTAAMFA